MLGDQRKMRMAAGHETKAVAAGVFHGTTLDELAVPLPPLGNPANPASCPVRHPFLNEIEDAARELRQPGIGRGEGIKLVAVEDQEPNPVIVINVFVEDLDADDVADDVDRSIVVAANPYQMEIVAVGIAANDLRDKRSVVW